MSSIVSLSMSFLRLVACFAFATFDEKRWMNSFSSAIFSSLLFFSSFSCFAASWDDMYQKS